jgi:hypothetical protein
MIVIMPTSALIVTAFSGKRLYTIWTHSSVLCETLIHTGGGLTLVLKPVLLTVSLHLHILCLYRKQRNMNEWRLFLKLRMYVVPLEHQSSQPTWECVAVVSTECLHYVIALWSPRSCFPVSFDAMDQLGASILQSQCVSVIFVQFLKHPYTVRIKLQVGGPQYSQGIQLLHMSDLHILQQ